MTTRDRVDWAAKKFLLNALQEEEKLSWTDPWLQSIDLEYHNVDLESRFVLRAGAAGLDPPPCERRRDQVRDLHSAGNDPRVFPRAAQSRGSTIRSRRFSGTNLFSKTARCRAG